MSTVPSDHARPDHPTRIGPYRIRRVLGQGGMGLVYEAEQTEPLTRLVALKVIKLGMDTKDVVARFATERQALAVMDHPSIAKAFDAGATEAGRPYFAMELVRGVPLTEYCDTHKLTTSQRILLFIEICHGVQHAHQKGVIHRDLKPSNLLVAVQDDRPVPKIIDFGIAKAMDRRLGDGTFATQLGQLVGTPVYMSPEQAEMSGLDIDTRSDIYSLGIVLYELVSGSLPFDPGALDRADFIAQHIIRKKDAPTPSTRFASLGAARAAVAEHRHTTPVALRKELKGDLDWIVLKAIEKDRTRRYETANGLALDLQRLLRNEPISARPPSATYAIRKFVQRNRLGVALGAVATLAVLGVAIVMTVLAERVSKERNRAELEAAKAKSINRFMLDMLSSADPWQGGAHEVTVQDALGKAVGKLDGAFKTQPLVDAAVRQVIGAAYDGLGRTAEAEPLLVQSLRRRQELLGDANEDVALSLTALGTLRRDQGRYDSAAALFGRALAIRRRLDGAEGLSVAGSLVDLAGAEDVRGNTARADSLARQALAIRKRLLGDENTDVAIAMRVVGGYNISLGKYAAAESLSRPAVAIMRKTIGPRHPELASAINDLALERMYQGDFVEAEHLLRETVAMDSAMFGPAHPALASDLENLGNVFYSQQRYGDALEILRQVLDIRRTMLGDTHEAVGRTIANLAAVTRRKGDYHAAQPLFEDALRRLTTTVGPNHPSVIHTMVGSGNNLTSLGEYVRAEAVLRDAMRRASSSLGTPWALDNVGAPLSRMLRTARSYADAEQTATAVYQVRDSMYGPTHPDTRSAAAQLDTLYQKLNRPNEAATYRDKAKAK